MKTDYYKTIVKDYTTPDTGWGDSCAETGRMAILSGAIVSDENVKYFDAMSNFVVSEGFVRHPYDYEYPDWGVPRFSNDQLIPLMLAYQTVGKNLFPGFFFIKGTKTILQPVAVALYLRQYWLVNILNVAQGLLLKFPWRWSDSQKKFTKTENSPQDYLNYFVIYLFLKKRGNWATMVTDKDEIMKKVTEYYSDEPNSDWVVTAYKLATLLV